VLILAGSKGYFAMGAILTTFETGITYGPHPAAVQETIVLLEMYLMRDRFGFQYFDSDDFKREIQLKKVLPDFPAALFWIIRFTAFQPGSRTACTGCRTRGTSTGWQAGYSGYPSPH
jgi:hypothetical protein